MNRIAWRQITAALMVMALANVLYDAPLPIDTTNAQSFVVTGVFFVTFVYVMRNLFRLPFAIRTGYKRYRHAFKTYGLSRYEAIMDGIHHGLLDRTQWEQGIRATLDRTVYLLIVWFACQPQNRVWVVILGIFGIIFILAIYTYNGRFALLLSDSVQPDTNNPFDRIPNLRRFDDPPH